MATVSSKVRRSFSLSTVSRLLPLSSFMEYHIKSPPELTRWMGMMLGWSSAAAVRASRWKRWMARSPKARVGGSTLMATRRRSWISVARYTMPIPPRPISRSISYSPAVSCRSRRVNVATPTASSDGGPADNGSGTSAPQLVQKRPPSGTGLAQLAQSMVEYDTSRLMPVPASGATSWLPARRPWRGLQWGGGAPGGAPSFPLAIGKLRECRAVPAHYPEMRRPQALVRTVVVVVAVGQDGGGEDDPRPQR